MGGGPIVISTTLPTQVKRLPKTEDDSANEDSARERDP